MCAFYRYEEDLIFFKGETMQEAICVASLEFKRADRKSVV